MLHSSHHLLRSREEERASVSYSELLFDLIYVFAVTLRRCSAFICRDLDDPFPAKSGQSKDNIWQREAGYSLSSLLVKRS